MQEVSVAEVLLCDAAVWQLGIMFWLWKWRVWWFSSLCIHSWLGLSHRRFTPTGSSDSTRLIWLVCMFQSDGCIIHLPSPSAFSNASDGLFKPVWYKAKDAGNLPGTVSDIFVFLACCTFPGDSLRGEKHWGHFMAKRLWVQMRAWGSFCV